MNVKINELNSALDTLTAALLKPQAVEMNQEEKRALAVIGMSLVLDVRRIADALEKLAEPHVQ